MFYIRKISMVLYLIFFLSGCTSKDLLKISELEVHPDSKYKTTLEVIESATQTLDVVNYQFKDKIIRNALLDAKKRNVKIRVMIADLPENYEIKEFFEREDIEIKFGNPKYEFTHQKTLIVDSSLNCPRALIMTYNFKPDYFDSTRDFAVVINSKTAIREIQNVFNADWERKNYNPNYKGLVWSPNNSREKLLDLINMANSSIEIYDLLLEEGQIENALVSAVKRNVKVRLLLSPKHRNYSSIEKISKNGVDVRIFNKLFVHAKVIMVDRKTFFVGSQNLDTDSLALHRELGIISSDHEIFNKLNNIFEKDWSEAKRYFSEVSFIYESKKDQKSYSF